MAETALAQVKNETVNSVMVRVSDLQKAGRLKFPPNYSPENALYSAYLTLQQTLNRDKQPVLTACSKESVANTLLDMVVQGLNPSKKQCYFIAYGQQLTCHRSYFGTMAVAKRVTGAVEINAEVVYEGDTFRFTIERGNTKVIEHGRTLESIDKAKIVAAYCTVVLPDREYTQIMSLAQIHQAWTKSQNNPIGDGGQVKAGSVHGQFTEEMAKKTVTNRTCKALINSSMDDSLDLVIEHMNRADDAVEEAQFAEEVRVNANTGEILDAEYTEVPNAPEPAKKKDEEPDF